MMNRCSGGSFEKSKFRALRERNYLEQAEERNARLRQQIASSMNVQEQVMLLINKQSYRIPKHMDTNPRFNSLLDEGTRVFQSLRARLDARYNELDSILSRFPSTSCALSGRRNQATWPVSASDQGINVDFSESFAMPFSLEMILSIVGRHTSLHGLEVCAGNVRTPYWSSPMLERHLNSCWCCVNSTWTRSRRRPCRVICIPAINSRARENPSGN